MHIITPTKLVAFSECAYQWHQDQLAKAAGAARANQAERALGDAWGLFAQAMTRFLMAEPDSDLDTRLKEATTVLQELVNADKVTVSQAKEIGQFVKGFCKLEWPESHKTYWTECEGALRMVEDERGRRLEKTGLGTDAVAFMWRGDLVYLDYEPTKDPSTPEDKRVCRLTYIDHKLISVAREVDGGKTDKFPQFGSRSPTLRMLPKDIQLRVSLFGFARQWTGIQKFRAGHFYPRSGKLVLTSWISRDHVDTVEVEKEVLDGWDLEARFIESNSWPATECWRCTGCLHSPKTGDGSCPFFKQQNEMTAALMGAGRVVSEPESDASVSRQAESTVPRSPVDSVTQSANPPLRVQKCSWCGDEHDSAACDIRAAALEHEEPMSQPDNAKPAPPAAVSHEIVKGNKAVGKLLWHKAATPRRTHKIMVFGGPGLRKTRSILRAFTRRGKLTLCVSDCEGGTIPYDDEFDFLRLEEPDPERPGEMRLVLDHRLIEAALMDVPPEVETVAIDSFTALCDLIREYWRKQFQTRDLTSPGNKSTYYNLQPRDYQLINADIQRLVFALIASPLNVVVTAQPKTKYERVGSSFQATDDEIADAWKKAAHYFDCVIYLEHCPTRKGEIQATVEAKDRRFIFPPGGQPFLWQDDTLARALAGETLQLIDAQGKLREWKRSTDIPNAAPLEKSTPVVSPQPQQQSQTHLPAAAPKESNGADVTASKPATPAAAPAPTPASTVAAPAAEQKPALSSAKIKALQDLSALKKTIRMPQEVYERLLERYGVKSAAELSLEQIIELSNGIEQDAVAF